MGEPEFRQWVEDEWFDSAPSGVTPKIEVVTPLDPFDIWTYKARPPLTDPVGTITISNGLKFDWWEEDRGVHIAWDRATQRVYFNCHSH